MTTTVWRTALRLYLEGTRTEKLMASMLIELSNVDDPRVERIFDRYASDILEGSR